jgi:Uma2 family endonuclease
MPQTIEPPTKTLPPAVLPRFRWKAEQYESLFSLGVLTQGNYELIQGDIVEKMPIKDAHAYVITLLFGLFSGFLGFPVLRSQFTLWMDSETLPEPDFAVLSTPHPTLTAQGYLQPIDMRLLVEVSDATLDCDLTTKARLYARAGIAEYWVVDVTGRRLLIHGLPGSDGYTQVTQYSETDSAAPWFAPTNTFTVSQILP